MRRPRAAFTLVETVVTVLVVVVVIGIAYSMLTTTMREGRKAQGLSGAVQAGAIVLHALQTDLANLVKKGSAGEDAIVGEYSPSEDTWRLSFNRRKEKLEFDYREDGAGGDWGQVEYVARRSPSGSGLYEIVRLWDGREAKLSGAYAIAVEFKPLKDPLKGQRFIRINMLLVGDDVNPANVPEANRAKPYLLTLLCEVETV
jgi:type II secretory pathway pseudopilin PulG